jgi:hypothetical protein
MNTKDQAHVLLRSLGGFLLVSDQPIVEEICVSGFNSELKGLAYTETIGTKGEILFGTHHGALIGQK